MACYRSNKRCYRKGKHHEKKRKNASRNSRSLIHNLILNPTIILLSKVGLYLKILQYHSSLNWKKKGEELING